MLRGKSPRHVIEERDGDEAVVAEPGTRRLRGLSLRRDGVPALRHDREQTGGTRFELLQLFHDREHHLRRHHPRSRGSTGSPGTIVANL
jgi:hypothetical protein